jgi:hypothetical protein
MDECGFWREGVRAALCDGGRVGACGVLDVHGLG